MSLSRAERIENAHLALCLMIQELADDGINRKDFKIQEAPFENIFPTTWNYLEEARLIKVWAPRAGLAELTGRGWLKGLEIAGVLHTPELDEKVGSVMAEFSKHVKGRRNSQSVHSHEVAAAAGVSENFLHNFLLSNYIELVLKRRGVRLDPCIPGYFVTIPIDFNLQLM